MNKRKIILIVILLCCALAAAALAYWFYSPMRRIEVAEQAALDQLGKPYVFGTAGPDSFDCSGLMKYAYEQIGVELNHNTVNVAMDDQYKTIDDPADLRKGDLVYFNTINSGSSIDHVGFWLGKGRFVHASSAEKEVIVSDFDELWQGRFTVAKRIL